MMSKCNPVQSKVKTLIIDEVYAAYFRELGRMAASVEVDFIAHFDRVIWRGTLMEADFDPWRLEPIIRETLATMAHYGRALELNTRFLSHHPGWNEALVTMLRWYREAGGTTVIVNSDAHHTDHIGRNRLTAQQLLRDAGIPKPGRVTANGQNGHAIIRHTTLMMPRSAS